MAIKSAVNWHEKWYFSSNFFQYISESGYFVFSNAWAMVHCKCQNKSWSLESLDYDYEELVSTKQIIINLCNSHFICQ